MDETLRWTDFYEIDENNNVIDRDDFIILTTCDSYENAVIAAEKYFEGLKKIWR